MRGGQTAEETYAALDVPGDDDLRGGDAERTRNLLDHGEAEGLLDERAATEGRVRFED